MAGHKKLPRTCRFVGGCEAVGKLATNGFGQAVSGNSVAGGTSLGQSVKDHKESIGGSPNPANDNGGGND